MENLNSRTDTATLRKIAERVAKETSWEGEPKSVDEILKGIIAANEDIEVVHVDPIFKLQNKQSMKNKTENAENAVEAFEDMKMEVIDCINSLYSGNDDVTDKYTLDTKDDILKMILDFYNELIDEKSSILNSKWLRDNFSIAELEEHGIYIEGEFKPWEFKGNTELYLLGNVSINAAYYQGERIKIMMHEKASINLDITDTCIVFIEAYGENKIDLSLSGRAYLNLFTKNRVQSKVYAHQQSAVESRQHCYDIAIIEASDFANVLARATDKSKIELTASSMSKALIEVLEEAAIVINSKELSEIAIKKNAKWEGDCFVEKNSNSIKAVA